MSDFDELDELLGLIDEDDQTQEKKEEEKEKQIATQLKNGGDSELYVCASLRCKLRIDPLTRTISSEDLKLRLRRWSFVSLINLPLKLQNKCVTNGGFVIIGILSSKIIRHSKNNNKYLLIKIDDFNASISCFIFNAEIIEKFFKVQPGTILVIAGPQIINDKKQTGGGNNNISLKIESNEQILIMGKSVDFSFCNKLLNTYDKHSKCQNVVNKSKGDLCAFHKTKQYKKYASRRSDTNRGTIKFRGKNQKKSLSGRGSGISMIQTRNNQQNHDHAKKRRMSSVSYHENRKKTANLILNSSSMTPFMRSRMKKYTNGKKTMLQIGKNAKKKEMKQLLAGKPLIPHLGTNWNNTQHANNSNIVLKPKKNRKRTYDSMMENDLDPDNRMKAQNNKKRKLSTMACTDSKEKENIGQCVSDCEIAIDSEEKGQAIDSADQITSVQVTIFICKFKTCPLNNKLTEKANSFCKSHSMNVVKIMGRKYFWQCGSCKHKTHTLNTKLINKTKCRKCGSQKFKASSEYNDDLSKENANSNADANAKQNLDLSLNI